MRAADTVGRRAELLRKLVHASVSLVAAAVVWRLPPLEAAVVLAAATTIALSVELLRRLSGGFASQFQRWLGSLVRPHESLRLTGATTLSVGYTTAAVLLPGLPVLAGILLTGLADAVAAVVGKRFGSHRYPGGKSVEGSAAFLAAAWLILWALPGVGPLVALAMAALATALEAPTLPIDDNLYLPLATAASVAAVGWALGLQGFS